MPITLFLHLFALEKPSWSRGTPSKSIKFMHGRGRLKLRVDENVRSLSNERKFIHYDQSFIAGLREAVTTPTPGHTSCAALQRRNKH